MPRVLLRIGLSSSRLIAVRHKVVSAAWSSLPHLTHIKLLEKLLFLFSLLLDDLFATQIALKLARTERCRIVARSRSAVGASGCILQASRVRLAS